MHTVRVIVELQQDTPLHSAPFVSSSTGQPVAWLDVGDFEAGVYGSPAALRRLGLEAVRAAEDAEQLGRPAPGLAAA